MRRYGRRRTRARRDRSHGSELPGADLDPLTQRSPRAPQKTSTEIAQSRRRILTEAPQGTTILLRLGRHRRSGRLASRLFSGTGRPRCWLPRPPSSRAMIARVLSGTPQKADNPVDHGRVGERGSGRGEQTHWNASVAPLRAGERRRDGAGRRRRGAAGLRRVRRRAAPRRRGEGRAAARVHHLLLRLAGRPGRGGRWSATAATSWRRCGRRLDALPDARRRRRASSSSCSTSCWAASPATAAGGGGAALRAVRRRRAAALPAPAHAGDAGRVRRAARRVLARAGHRLDGTALLRLVAVVDGTVVSSLIEADPDPRAAARAVLAGPCWHRRLPARDPQRPRRPVREPRAGARSGRRSTRSCWSAGCGSPCCAPSATSASTSPTA